LARMYRVSPPGLGDLPLGLNLNEGLG